jgi:hypothetical protein
MTMEPKHGAGRMFLAPGAAVGASSFSFPSADRKPTGNPSGVAFPPVDEHLVKPEVSREEIIRGRKIITMGANPPHAEAHSRLDMLILPHVREGYVTASDLLTRVAHGSNFATDVSVRKSGIDPSTGSRYLEELSFEIVNEQTMQNVTEKAEDLVLRGVRRVFAIFVKTCDICEWSRTKNEFVLMNADGMFEDSLFVRPIAVRALVDAALAEAEVVRALEKKGNPEISRIRREAEDEGHKRGLDEGHKKGLDEGHKKGLDEGERRLLLGLVRKRFGRVPTMVETRVNAADAAQINAWAEKLLSASSLDEVFSNEAD